MKSYQAIAPLRALSLLMIFSAGAVRAQPSQGSGAGRFPSVPAQPAGLQSPMAAGPVARGVSRLAVSVTQMGAFRCVERADQLARFFGKGVGDIFIVDRPGSRPNADLISATMIVNQGAGNYPTIDISLVPTPYGCTAFYAASVSAAEPCEQAEGRLYRGLVFRPVQSGLPQRIATIGNEARVLSRPVPGGCLLTKHEVVR